MIGTRRWILGLILVLLIWCVGCGSTTTPVVPSILPAQSANPSTPTSAVPTDTPIVAGDSFVPAPLATVPLALPIAGFVAYDPVSMLGTEYQAFVDSQMNCDAVAGWMTAGDWRLDAEAISAEESTPPASGATVFPRIKWLALSWGTDAAIVGLAPTRGVDGAPGCEGRISRLSRQPLTATGPYTAKTSALVYQYACTPIDQAVTVVAFEFGDDGSRAVVRTKIPLLLGSQPVDETTIYLGQNDLSPTSVVAGMADGAISIIGIDRVVTGLTKLQPSGQSSAAADVSSIDPFVATLSFDALTNGSGGQPQALSTGVRCDVSDGALTQGAATPAPIVTPTVGPAGHLEISIGSGDSGLSRTFDGPSVTCSHVTLSQPTWDLQYNGGDNGLFMDLTIQESGESSLLLTEGDTFIQIEKARVGGDLHTTVTDGDTSVEFSATGTTPDGRPTTISATCAAISRL